MISKKNETSGLTDILNSRFWVRTLIMSFKTPY